MIKLAVVGTNWITKQFVDAALETGRFVLSAVYSRREESAKAFAAQFENSEQVTLFSDLDELGKSDKAQAVYVASPNSFHAPQAMSLLRAGKNVICEKPLASNYALAQQMYQVAQESGAVLFEAFMSPHTPNFKKLKEELNNIGALRQASISYCQRSSRYDRFLAGENPNTFNPEFSNGSIMDIGYYCLGSAVELFGRPTGVQAQANLLSSGVDGNGTVSLQYPDFNVVLLHSKTSDSYVPSEFQGEQAALQMTMISIGEKLERVTRGQPNQDLSLPQHANPMYYEALEFAEQVESNTINEECKARSLVVAELLTEIRSQTGVVFPADKSESL
ncbi:Gfo/Idh/MocA family protein [Vibrio mexicanus]|uniref:Gfo/Idh/MocA family protein n=1 Tax=Vibrio mexicanus TaxID=1004326 RepID=UPI00063BFA04|nr:Gfo/Idh/MocA family oxidoreductase [Vibrio mexicanus]